MPHPLLRILLRILRRRLIKLRSIILEHLCSTRLHCIIWNWLHKQILGRRQHTQDLGARLPGLGFQDADAHAAVLVEGHVRVPDSRLEVYLGGLKGVVGGKDEEELEFAALENRSALTIIGEGAWRLEGVIGEHTA